MVFNSYTFILFFAAVLALHYTPLPWKVKKSNLLWASYLFYAAWNPPFVVLIWISTLADWILAKRIYVTASMLARRALLVLSLGVNLGLLGYFKYGEFLLGNFTRLLGLAGIEFRPLPLDIVLPVGISFYTFQTLSYTLDIYRKQVEPWHSFLDYAMYVTFFPQLVAGPIVRAKDFLPQCDQPRKAGSQQLGWGLSLFALGLFEKNVLADGLLAPLAEKVYDADGGCGFLDAWTGTLAFGGQIFCDFAGYSTCAIGVGLCLGFSLPRNFRCPYAAVGFSDFWRRWHISLSSWLRDYLYISLGGNRKGRIRTYLNLMTTMLLGGLWHGASWTFVFWGGLHGAYLVAERLLEAEFGRARVWRTWWAKVFLGSVTFGLVSVAWVFFRADTFNRAWTIVSALFWAGGAEEGPALAGEEVAFALVTVGVILAIQWLMRDTTLESLAERSPWWARSIALGVMLTAIVLMPGEDRAFIYFQF